MGKNFHLTDYACFTDYDEIYAIEAIGVNDKNQKVRFLLSDKALKAFKEEVENDLDEFGNLNLSVDSLQDFLDKHPKYISIKDNLIQVDELPKVMLDLYENATGEGRTNGDDFVYAYEPESEQEQKEILEFIDNHPQLESVLLFEEGNGFTALGDFPCKFFDEELPYTRHGNELILNDVKFHEKLQRIANVCKEYHDATPMENTMVKLINLHNKLFPNPSNLNNVLDATLQYESMVNNSSCKTISKADWLVESGYALATKLADKVNKNEVTPITALKIGKMYMTSHGDIPKNITKANIWLSLAAKENNIKFEAMKLIAQTKIR